MTLSAKTSIPGDESAEIRARVAKRLWIVTPVFRDVASFLVLRDEITKVVAETQSLRDYKVRFVVADDSAGSDPRIRELDDLQDVEIIVPPFNLGHQRALVFALRRAAEKIAKDDLIITLDADGEDRPEDIPRLIDAVLVEKDDSNAVALARRTQREEKLGFKLFYQLFKLMFWTLTGTMIRTGNFAAYRGSVIPRIEKHPYFDVSYSAALNRVGLNRHYVPCPRGLRYAGESRMNTGRLMLHGLSMLVPFSDRIALRAMLTSTVTFIASILLALAVVAIRLFSYAEVPGWTTYTLLALFLSSLVALGNFVILFIVFTQSRGMSLGGLEDRDGR